MISFSWSGTTKYVILYAYNTLFRDREKVEKTLPKGILFHIDFLIDFSMDFWAILDPILAPFWSTFPSFLHHFFEHESLMICLWFLDELLMDFWWAIPQKTLYFLGKTNIFIKSPFRKQTQKIMIFGPMLASFFIILASIFITFSASIFAIFSKNDKGVKSAAGRSCSAERATGVFILGVLLD